MMPDIGQLPTPASIPSLWKEGILSIGTLWKEYSALMEEVGRGG